MHILAAIIHHQPRIFKEKKEKPLIASANFLFLYLLFGFVFFFFFFFLEDVEKKVYNRGGVC